MNHNHFHADSDADLEDRIWLRRWAERRGISGALAPEDEPEAWAA
ncbi:hypothetical protein [Nocardia terpenica]|nr:hypothetical protein [Nocardia terpenica]